MGMSIPYELSGRTNQKARTRAALLDATRALLAEGVSPTVEQAADRAAISRTTAYRYFANQRALLTAVFPEIAARSLLDADSPTDPAARLELMLERFTRHMLEHEPALRAQLRLSLEPRPAEPDQLPFRKGRAIGWIEDALVPHEIACWPLSCAASCSRSAPQPGLKRSSGSPTSPASHAKRQAS